MDTEINKQEERAVQKFWLNYYVNADIRLCSLCGNSGQIDTRGRAISYAGVDAGRVNYCICPNGVAMRRNQIPLNER